MRALVDEAREQAEKGLAGSMEGHADMDMSVTEGGSLWQRLDSERGFTAISHYFVMDWAAVWSDIAGGLAHRRRVRGVGAGRVLAGVLPDRPSDSLAKFWGPIVGPLVAVISFVCSVGNVPLAAVLWNGGISFGGVIAFIFADLIVIPILNIYRKYYGAEDGPFPVRDVLCRHGTSGADHRDHLRRSRSHPCRA